MKHPCSLFFRSVVILSISILSILSTSVFSAGEVQANIGGLTENITAARIGIGTTFNMSRNLHVVGSPLFERAVDTAGFLIKRTATNRWFLGVNENPAIGYGFVISTFPEGAGSSTPRVLVTQNGNVGIGTTSPSAMLDVISGSDIGIKSSSHNNYGVYGISTTSSGILGSSASTGVEGVSTIGRGVYGTSDSGRGVQGYSANNIGVYGQSDNISSYAGYFQGNALATGTMTANELSYSIPRTHYYSIPGGEFTPSTYTTEYIKGEGLGQASVMTGSGRILYAPVHLPDGATVTGFTVYFNDNSSYDLTVTLHRQDLPGGYSVMASVTSTGISGYGNASDTTIDYALIDNANYGYIINAYWTTADGSNLGIMGARITYTISKAE